MTLITSIIVYKIREVYNSQNRISARKKVSMVIKKPTKKWSTFLNTRYGELTNSKPSTFANLTQSKIPKEPGVYLISAKKGKQEVPYYIGRTKNLRNRLYRDHLMGRFEGARLKKYLVENGECEDITEAKEFIKKNCRVRWITEEDIRNRGAIEGYATGLLFPKYGIYEEH